MHTTINSTGLLIFAYSTGVLAGNCEFLIGESSPTTTLNFGRSLAGSGLTIPLDAPIGTVIFEETMQAPNYMIWCNQDTLFFGLTPAPGLGALPPKNNTLFPLGKTGLSYRFQTSLGNYATHQGSSLKGYTKWSFLPGTYKLQIVKSAELQSQNSFAGGYLGQWRADEAIMAKIYLINPIVLNTASCQTPSVAVQMGDDYGLSEFDTPGAHPRVTKFNIGLQQCQQGIKKVTYSLKATTRVIDKQKGIVALNNEEDAAQGIGLQLMNGTGQPIALDTTYTFDGFNTTDKNFNIPLSAAYYRLPDGIADAGHANTQVTYIVSYL